VQTNLTGDAVKIEPDLVMPNYMNGFNCLGSACENDCCHGWQVAVDRKAYKALKVAMGGNKAERTQFREFLQRNRSEQKGQSSYAHIKLGQDRRCPFLDDKKLCAIQSQYGSRCLGRVCQTYPRVMARVGKRTELHGSLSCPEVARRCLLDEEALDTFSKMEKAFANRSQVLDAFTMMDAHYHEVDSTDVPIWWYDDKNYNILYETSSPDSGLAKVDLNTASLEELATIPGIDEDQTSPFQEHRIKLFFGFFACCNILHL